MSIEQYQPDQEQIDHWIKVSQTQIDGDWERFKEGYYERKVIPIQSVYTGFGLLYASLGRAHFLNGEPEEYWRAPLREAARCIIKSFRMAYDPKDPDFQGDRVEWSEVSEGDAISGFKYALMAADFELAQTLASLFRDPGDGDTMHIEINDFAHALSKLLLGQRKEALALAEARMQVFERKPPTGYNYKTNYYTLMTTLYGILIRDTVLFNKGLLEQVNFYARYAKGEGKNTSEEYICDEAVALANLGLHEGLKVTVQDMRLPTGMLIARSS